MNKFKMIFKKIKFKLVAFVGLLTIGCGCLLSNNSYAWFVNEQGNLESSNLLPIEYIHYADNFVNLTQNVNLDRGTYTISYSNQLITEGSWEVRLNDNVIGTYNLSQTSITFNVSNDNTSFYFYCNQPMFNARFMLNEGNTALLYEPYGTFYSSTNYNDLLTNYNNLLSNTTYGWLSYLSDITINASGVVLGNQDFNKLVSNNYINYGIFKLNDYVSSYSISTNYVINMYFYDDFNGNDYFNANLFYLSVIGNITSNYFNVEIIDTLGNSTTFTIDTTNLNYIDYNLILNNNRNFNGNIYNINISFTTINNVGNLYITGGYSAGYQNGWNNATNAKNLEIESLNEQLTLLQTNFNQLQSDYNNLRIDYDSANQELQDYLDTIHKLNNDVVTLTQLTNDLRTQVEDNFTWQNLFFTMADTPFRVVANALGFNVFGINLFATFIGLTTTLAIIFLVKKFI